jgi:hypothetical protein
MATNPERNRVASGRWQAKAIRDGVATLTLAKLMGTSVMQLEDTYVRWLKSDADRLRSVFDEADARADAV